MRRAFKCLVGGVFLLGLTSCGHKTPEIQPTVEKVAPLPAPAEKAPQPRPLPSTRKIGLLLPLSGQHTELGQALLNAAEIAIFESNNPSLELLPQDTAPGAKVAAQRALKEGAELLLGPVFAQDVTAIKGLSDVSILCFSTDQRVAGHGTYVLGFLPSQQIERIIAFAKGRGITKIAALTPEDPYGQVVDKTLARLAAQGEVELLGITHYAHEDVLEGNPGNQGIIDEVESYKNRGMQALLIPEGGEHLHNLARILSAEGLPVLLGSGQWDAPETLTVPELKGAFFASADPLERQEFENRFQKQYGTVPPRIASLGYDAVAVASALSDTTYSSQALTGSQGFTGIEGLFRLTPEGLNERGLAILEVTPSGFRALEPAPRAF